MKKLPRIVVTKVSEDAYTFHRSVDTPKKCVDFYRKVVARQPDFEADKEGVVVLCLNTKLKPVCWNRVSVGSLDGASCHPREVFRPAVAAGAYAVLVYHNHPSGDPTPSKGDKLVTRRLKSAGEILQVHLIDHIIIGDKDNHPCGHYSFREAGLL
jgi:DNA repair protein RadC